MAVEMAKHNGDKKICLLADVFEDWRKTSYCTTFIEMRKKGVIVKMAEEKACQEQLAQCMVISF